MHPIKKLLRPRPPVMYLKTSIRSSPICAKREEKTGKGHKPKAAKALSLQREELKDEEASLLHMVCPKK